MKRLLLVIVPLAILAGGWLLLKNPQSKQTPLVVETEKSSAQSENTAIDDSPADNSTIDYRIETAETNSKQPNAQTTEQSNTPEVSNTATFTQTDTSTIGVGVISDEQFNHLQNRLSNEPALLNSLLEELRYNTDLDRGKRIAALIGELPNPEIVQAAAELAYSGDPASQRIGLDLLSRLQPHNNEARDIAIELLASETDPGMLVSTMNALATPTRSASNSQRVQLIDNLNLLAKHSDPLVRSHSISLLGRWNPGAANNNTILTEGLTDQNPTVRARSAAAFIGKTNVDEASIYRLLVIAENKNEIKTTRQSAIYALKKMQLPADAKSRYEQAVVAVRRTRQ